MAFSIFLGVSLGRLQIIRSAACSKRLAFLSLSMSSSITVALS
jgi:hypothetical protein